MEKIRWFIYGLLTGFAIVLLGIIGWGFNLFMRVITLAPTGLMVVFGILAFVIVLFWILKPSQKKQIIP